MRKTFTPFFLLHSLSLDIFLWVVLVRSLPPVKKRNHTFRPFPSGDDALPGPRGLQLPLHHPQDRGRGRRLRSHFPL